MWPRVALCLLSLPLIYVVAGVQSGAAGTVQASIPGNPSRRGGRAPASALASPCRGDSASYLALGAVITVIIIRLSSEPT
jgi:hypothetical protein